VLEWAGIRHRMQGHKLKEAEDRLAELVNREVGFMLNDEELKALKDLESTKNRLLLEEEMEWHLKSRAAWIALFISERNTIQSETSYNPFIGCTTQVLLSVVRICSLCTDRLLSVSLQL
jgi:hypothetical protein